MTPTRSGIATVVACMLAGPATSADWPVFRGSPEMSGVSPNKVPEKLDEKWKFKTGNAIEGAPAVVGGVVYVASSDKHLYAIDLKTGQEKWKAKIGAPTKASPGVKGDRVYLGDADGKFYCFDVANGRQSWVVEAGGEINSGCNFFKDKILVGSYDGSLTCLAADGKKDWEFKLDQPVNGSPAVAGNRTFVAGCDSVVHIIDAENGKEVGSVDIGGQAGATAAVSGDDVYVGTMANQVVGINWKAPKKLWSFEAPRRQQPFYASAAVTDSLVIAGSRDKKVYGLDRTTGKETWSFITDGQVECSPAVAGGRVYVGCQSADGYFYVLDLKTGAKIQELNLDGAVTGSPAIGPDCVLIGTEKGTLFCLGTK